MRGPERPQTDVERALRRRERLRVSGGAVVGHGQIVHRLRGGRVIGAVELLVQPHLRHGRLHGALVLEHGRERARMLQSGGHQPRMCGTEAFAQPLELLTRQGFGDPRLAVVQKHLDIGRADCRPGVERHARSGWRVVRPRQVWSRPPPLHSRRRARARMWRARAASRSRRVRACAGRPPAESSDSGRRSLTAPAASATSSSSRRALSTAGSSFPRPTLTSRCASAACALAWSFCPSAR